MKQTKKYSSSELSTTPTLGPWKIRGTRDGLITIETESGGFPVCNCFSMDTARLIALTPELLKVAQRYATLATLDNSARCAPNFEEVDFARSILAEIGNQISNPAIE